MILKKEIKSLAILMFIKIRLEIMRMLIWLTVGLIVGLLEVIWVK